MERILTTKNNIDVVIQKAVEVLKSGGIVIYPTETCYGVGVCATNKLAVDKVLEYKSRPEGKPISIAVKDKKMAFEYVEINSLAENIYNNLLPGPITVISKSKGKTSNRLESEKNTLGIRIPDHEVPLKIVQKLGAPITSTSANVSGKKTPYTIEDVLEELSEKKIQMIDLIIDFGELPKNPPSTVIDTTLMEINVIRGGVVQFDKVNDIFDLNGEEDISKVVKFVFDKFYTKDKILLIKLDGAMGAGKTHFVKYLGKYLNTKDRITSPTYTIHHEYRFEKNKIHHMDLWRLENDDEVRSLQLEKYLVNGDIVAVEWAAKFPKSIEDWTSNATVVNIYIDINLDEKRKVLVSYASESNK